MPSTIFRRLKREFGFLGERTATEEDLYAFCAGRNVEVVFNRVIERGIYARRTADVPSAGIYNDTRTRREPRSGLPRREPQRPRSDVREVIFLNSNLHGTSLIYVLAHEIAHMILHVPSRCSGDVTMYFDGRLCRKNHAEAETAAALLIWPTPASVSEMQDHMTDEMLTLAAVRLDHAFRHDGE